ncbi:MAG: hypothetical protein LQ338_002403 [Usnochroma carphineum]|nr:MAG: hypothetical protein LQ338_002403 [Usnochroma carphineum]
MTRYNVALLSLLASTAAAVPHYGQYGHRHPVPHKSGSHSSGIFPPGPYPTGGPTAPYGQGNTTAVGPTGSAPVSSNPALTSLVTVVPQPVSSGSGNSPVGGSSAAGECGPATVTVTSANTVTVTVPASSAPVGSAPVESPIPTTSAPYSNGTSTAPVGTGSAGTESALPSFTASSPIIPVPGPSSNGVQLPSVAHPVPLASSTNEDSPLASSTNENSPETAATTSPSAGGQFYQSQTTPAVVPSSTVANSPEQASSPLSTPTSSPAPSSTIANSPEQASSSSSTPKPSTAPSTDSVIPRGLVYNEASLTSHFDNAPVGWLYNWDSSPGGAIDTSKEFIPMLWNTSEVYHTPHWAANADAAIAAGSKHLLAFNEPDLAAQANMDVGQSVQGWMTYMEPFHAKHNGDVKLGSPSVCNGPDQNQGLAYLTSFLSQCAGCHVDFLAIHWYGLATDDGVQDLKDHVGKAVAMAEGRPVWLTEFQPQGSDEQQAGFLGKILPWLDDGSNGVERYAYYRVDTMVSGSSLTQAGAAYAA